MNSSHQTDYDMNDQHRNDRPQPEKAEVQREVTTLIAEILAAQWLAEESSLEG